MDSAYKKKRQRRRPTGKVESVSLADVARVARVSTASVSRVINSPSKVSPGLRARIEVAIEQLGYIPSGAARALATRQSRAIGVIVPTLNDAIFAAGINALQRRLAQLEYALLVASSEYEWDQEVIEAQALLAHGVEGLMLVGEAHDPHLYHLLDIKGTPFVNTWTYRADAPYPCIGFDNHQAAYRLARYLLDLGHRHIGMIAGITRRNDRAVGRLMGVRDALAERGLSLPPQWIIEQPYGVRQGREGLRALLDTEKGWPTAVVCGNDVLALGALLECQAQGIEVPGQISITGFDDLPISAHLQPALTTVRVPSAEMGIRAAEFLVRSSAGERVLPHAEVDTSVVVRGTTAPPRATALAGHGGKHKGD